MVVQTTISATVRPFSSKNEPLVTYGTAFGYHRCDTGHAYEISLEQF